MAGALEGERDENQRSIHERVINEKDNAAIPANFRRDWLSQDIFGSTGLPQDERGNMLRAF
jgi:hypothetical protein